MLIFLIVFLFALVNSDSSQEKRFNNFFPSWSPDGARVVFQSDRDGDDEIYIIDIDGSHATRLTSTPGRDAHPSFSRDGKNIAFQSPRDGTDPLQVEIYTMASDGSNQKRVTRLGGFSGVPSWSPDGKRIIFQVKKLEKNQKWVEGFWQIYVMNADGSGVKQLTRGNSNFQVPNWSPDGSKILYFSDQTGNNEIFVMNSDGSNQRQLTDNKADDFLGCWSPDGKNISFVSNRDSRYEIYVMKSNGKDPTRITYSLGDTIYAAQGSAEPSWSPDGKYILLAATINDFMDLYVVHPDGSGLRRFGKE